MEQQTIFVPVIYSEREMMPHFHLPLPATTKVNSQLLEDRLDEELRRVLSSPESQIQLTQTVCINFTT